MRKNIIVLSIFLFAILTLSFNLKAEENEKSQLFNSPSLGDWYKAKKVKKSGKLFLQVWEPYVEYAKTITDSLTREAMLMYTNKINIEYDEIWVWERDDVFSHNEKKKFHGKFDIHKLYWKNNQVQAFTLKNYFIFDPVSNKKVGKHKITQVWNRDSVLSSSKKTSK
jgi:hypothetical protein